jgi:hypothetical protein
MNTGFGVIQVSLRLVIEPSDHSVSNHLPSPRRCSGIFYVGLTGPQSCGRPFKGPVRHLGFATHSLARRNGRPNRVHLRYGLIVHLQLLPTPPHGDAVTFGYGMPEHSGKDFHPADSMQLKAHECGSLLPLSRAMKSASSRRTPNSDPAAAKRRRLGRDVIPP